VPRMEPLVGQFECRAVAITYVFVIVAELRRKRRRNGVGSGPIGPTNVCRVWIKPTGSAQCTDR
jgi:hypothetical protein